MRRLGERSRETIVRNLSGQLSEILHSAVRGEESWQALGDAIFADLPGAASGFIRFDGGSAPGAATSFMSHFRTSFVRPFEEHYSKINPWFPALQKLANGQVLNLQDVEATLYEHTEFYNDFILGHGEIDGGSVFKLAAHPGSLLILTVQYPHRFSDPYDEILRQVLAKTRVRFEEALDTTSYRIGAFLDGACESAIGVADAQGQSGFVIDQNRVLTKATMSGVALLERGKGIGARNCRIHFNNHDDDTWLSNSLRLLRRAEQTRSAARTLQIGNGFHRAELWRLPRPSVGVPSFTLERFALILRDIGDLDTKSGTLEMARHYELSKSETQVVTELAADRTLSEIADRLGVSIHTIRSQLKSAMRKTECRRQSELVAKVFRFSS